jgi:hypothetical protein
MRVWLDLDHALCYTCGDRESNSGRGDDRGKTVTAVYDGCVLHLELPSDLEPDKRYLITIQSELPSVTEGDAWDILEALTGTLEALDDWAGEHDHYLYGTPKRQPEPTE